MKNEAPKTDEELRARIQAEVDSAIGFDDEVQAERDEAIRYYHAEPFGNEVEGRSNFVDSTVQDSIEWIMPSLMRVFASGDELVQFAPHGPEDVQMAEQATDYTNYVVTKDNHGWDIFSSWFRDALLQKNGTVKVWWNYKEETERNEYKGISGMEIEAMLQDPDVDIVEQDEVGMGEDQQPIYDLATVTTKEDGRIKIENVPPEEFLINREAKSIEDARFVCHRVRLTLSDLREMYPDEDLDIEDLKGGDVESDNPHWNTNQVYNRGMAGFGMFDSPATEDSLGEYFLYESYLRTDWDDDGIAELRQVCSVGDKILANEPVDHVPFITLTPLKIPHKFYGLSVADLVMPLQRIKSTLMRNLLDNIYNQNYGRYAVLEGQANLDDLLTARPGGIVRVKSPNAVMPLATPALEPYTFQMLEYIDNIRESRAGVSKYAQGLSDDALTSHTTATAVNAVMTAAGARVELIARQFAETGVKELMRRVYQLLIINQDQERVVKLRNHWVPVDPSTWRDKMDCTVSVALGSGSKEQQIGQLNQVLQMATQGKMSGDPMITGENMYNISAALLKAMGMQNVDDYITPVEAQQPPGPSPEEQKDQADMENAQTEVQIKQGKLALDQQEFQHQVSKDEMDLKMKVAELETEITTGRHVKLG